MFLPQEFVQKDSKEIVSLFPSFKNDELLELAKHFKKPATTQWRKAEIRKVVLTSLLKEDILSDDAAQELCVFEMTSDQIYNLQLRKIELEEKKLKQQEQDKEQERELEEKKLKQQEQDKEKERELEEKKLKQQEQDKEKERELEEKKLKLQELKMEHEHAERMAEIKLKTSPPTSQNFDILKHFSAVPPFQETDVDTYFLNFEKMAKCLRWPKEYWITLLQKVLTGRAREIFTHLSAEQSNDYDYVKDLILRSYQLNPEAYRQQFRNCRKDVDQTYVEFARIKEQHFDRWCRSKSVGQDFEKLRQLILIEEFKRCVHNSIKTFIDEKKVETVHEAADFADEYFLTHKSAFISKVQKEVTQSVENSSPPRPSPSSSSLSADSPVQPNDSQSSLLCNYCKKHGHLIAECTYLKRKQKREEANDIQTVNPSGHISSLGILRDSIMDSHGEMSDVKIHEMDKTSVFKAFQPFIFDGSVSLANDSTKSTPIRILRDTGSSQSLILADTLPFSPLSYTGAQAFIQGIGSDENCTSVPLHRVHLSSSVLSGSVVVGLRSSLPFKGVQLLLGNDLAGDKVVNPANTNIVPALDQPYNPLEKVFCLLSPSCIINQTMDKKVFHQRNITNMGITNVSSWQGNDSDVTDTRSSEEGMLDNKIKMKALREQQISDPKIADLFHKSVGEKEVVQEPNCFYTRHGVLMRTSRPHSVQIDKESTVYHQLVVPKPYQNEILTWAHEATLSGHLGVKKTYSKILGQFYWPKLKRDVAEFCRSCHACHAVGKLT